MPADYIGNAALPPTFTLEKFKNKFRDYPWARKSQKFVKDHQIERLFEMSCDFLREKSGIPPMREAGVLRDMEKCEKLIITVGRKLGGIEALLQKSITGGGHWTVKLGRPILNDVTVLRKRVRETLYGDELHQLHLQRSWASKLKLKVLTYEFTLKLERFVTKLLIKFPTKLPLPEKKQKQNTNALMAAVFVAAREMHTSTKKIDIARIRRARYNAHNWQAKPPLTQEEIEEYEIPNQWLRSEKKREAKRRERKKEAVTTTRKNINALFKCPPSSIAHHQMPSSTAHSYSLIDVYVLCLFIGIAFSPPLPPLVEIIHTSPTACSPTDSEKCCATYS
jgi:hypothetical protein